jgi:GT2 family glycosyltransferase
MRERALGAVVPAYEGGAVLERCIEALLASRPVPPRLVIVGNGNADGACDRVFSRWGAAVEIVRPSANLGFAGGVNAGIAHLLRSAGASARLLDAIVLVNQDCLVEPEALAALAHALDDAGVGIAGAYLLEPDGRTLQHAGGVVHANGLTDHLGRGQPWNGGAGGDVRADRETALTIDYVTGALCAFRPEIWRRFGPLDAGYFPAYFEEVDFCLKLRCSGYRVVCDPAARAVHVEAGTSGRGSRLHRALYHRSRMRFAARHLLRRATAAGALRAEALWLVRQRSWRELRPVFGAYTALADELRARPRAGRGRR